MVAGRDLLRWIGRDESGAAAVELVIVLNVVLLVTIAFVELGVAVNQWSLAAKAVQVGARLAAVSDPIDPNLSTFTGLGGENIAPLAGDPIDPDVLDFTSTCSGGTCSSGFYDATAMDRLVYGSDSACDAAPNTIIGICDVFPNLDNVDNPATHVVVNYTFTGLGYAGRPSGTGKEGGPVPTITVSLTGLSFDFLLLGSFLGLNNISLPPLSVTIVGEDLSTDYLP